MIRLFDGHSHLETEEEMRARRESGIITMVCAGTPGEARRLLEAAEKDGSVIPAAGLHPWHSGDCQVKEMLLYMKEFPVIGEIGMDSVWCQVPIETQRRVFEAQLEAAAILQKPVVLHTKGMEEEIGRLIGKYKNRYLVHWYSSMDFLDLYLEQGCYFTLGPDLAANPAVRQVAQRAGADRLMVETDGRSAVLWALGELPADGIFGLLKRSMELAADIKGISFEEIRSAMEENFIRFTKTPLQ